MVPGDRSTGELGPWGAVASFARASSPQSHVARAPWGSGARGAGLGSSCGCLGNGAVGGRGFGSSRGLLRALLVSEVGGRAAGPRALGHAPSRPRSGSLEAGSSVGLRGPFPQAGQGLALACGVRVCRDPKSSRHLQGRRGVRHGTFTPTRG